MEDDQKEMISNVFDFRESKVSEVMTPRTDISAISSTESLEKVLHTFIDSGHSKLPVFEKDLDNIEKNMEKWKFIIQSMTNQEKQDPDLINSSRIKRIAKGSGRTEKEIKELLNRYKQSKQMFKAGKGRNMRQLMKKLGAN